jgi:tryptophan 2,3-dioxygenase
MTPMNFRDFRDDLRPASGFQSWQFKLHEAKLGLKFEHRHGQEYCTAQLKPGQVTLIKRAEENQPLLQLAAAWLERMPDWYPGFWIAYGDAYAHRLAEVEKTT